MNTIQEQTYLNSSSVTQIYIYVKCHIIWVFCALALKMRAPTQWKKRCVIWEQEQRYSCTVCDKIMIKKYVKLVSPAFANGRTFLHQNVTDFCSHFHRRQSSHISPFLHNIRFRFLCFFSRLNAIFHFRLYIPLRLRVRHRNFSRSQVRTSVHSMADVFSVKIVRRFGVSFTMYYTLQSH